jgi:hypothetical protein
LKKLEPAPSVNAPAGVRGRVDHGSQPAAAPLSQKRPKIVVKLGGGEV